MIYFLFWGCAEFSHGIQIVLSFCNAQWVYLKRLFMISDKIINGGVK